jgi:hypothetical protein
MEWGISLELLIITPLNDGEPSTPVVVLITTK